MRRRLLTVHSSLVAVLLFSCTPTPSPLATHLFIYRFDPPAFLEFSEDFQLLREFPFSIPVHCGLYDVFSAPIGAVMAIELSCPNGQTVLFLDTESGAITQPSPDTDSHFLAWQSDGLAAYLKADSLGNPRIVRAFVSGAQDILSISEFTYDLAARPDSGDFTFTLSRGMGYGSELYLAKNDGRDIQLLYTDPFNYLSYARFSPDGRQIAFIKIPDSQTPFTVGELWVMNADGSNARKLAEADAGHGYAADWSADGTKIAFVVRENPEDEGADRSSEALISNVYIVEVGSGDMTQVTYFEEGRAETPHWSADGNILTFNAVVADGRMTVFLADLLSGEVKPLVNGPACCPAWMRK